MMAYISKWMLACDEAGYLISYREEHRLGLVRWWRLQMHLLSCHLCRKYARQIKQLSHSLEQYREQCSHDSCSHSMTEEASARIHREIDNHLKAN